MMIKKIVFVIALLFVTVITAQEPVYKSYSWDKKPDYTKFDTDPDADIIAFKDKIISEFYYPEKEGLTEYVLEHRLLWLNSDEKIEDYNKIYLPYRSNSKLLVSKARVISKDGTIQELDESKILTAQDEETQRTYKYFAFEGVTKGSFIEYYYVVRQAPNYKGNRVTMQSSYLMNNVEFDLYSPKNLFFKFKSYNGLPDVKRDTLTKDKLHWALHIKSVEKLEKEDLAPYNALKKYLVYKLDYNKANNTHGISSYDNISKNVYDFLFVDISKNEAASIEKLVNEARLKDKKDDVSKIRALENYIKKNFYISEINSDELRNIKSVIDNKAASEIGLMRIYIAALKSVGIPTEVVLTSDRSQVKFDNDFEADNFLTDYLLYFPSVKKYTSVKEMNSRLGYPPSELTDNYGLFIKEVALGNYKSGVGKIKYIKAPDAEETVDTMLIDVSFDPDDLTKNYIKLDRSFSGYYAIFIQPFLDLVNKEDADKLYDQLIKSMNDRITIKKKTVFNDKSELFGIKPFRLVADIETDVFVDKAGRKYLFKLGELIGPQIEMYQKKKRQLPVESDYNRIYNRVINVEIPQGYQISNLDDINIHHFYERDGKKLLEFHSYYKLDGNKLTVYADEYYKINKIGLNFFEDYRSVINSAADFNKIVLVLAPVK